MQFVGEWWVCDDNVTRPTLPANVVGAGGNLYAERFLVDTCADRTVLSATLWRKLQLPANPQPPGHALAGISGTSPFVEIATVIELTSDEGVTARVRGNFAAFTDPRATDLSILGRDVLDLFDLIVSRRRNAVLLLAPNHQYHVTRQ